MRSYDKVLEILKGGEKHRVWSLVVTIFGDLALEKGTEISGKTLASITEQIGVKSEALRVALHRLKKDGWLNSRRQGRNSLYYLTDHGYEQTTLARPRIYGLSSPSAEHWAYCLASSSSEASQIELERIASQPTSVRLGANAVLTQQPYSIDLRNLLITDFGQTHIPEWLKSDVFHPSICEAYLTLFGDLTKAKSNLTGEFSPLECAVLRTLIVHSWRRVLLRHVDVPDVFYPANCSALQARAHVMDLLEILPRPEIKELSEN